MFCKQCGQQIADQAAVCIHCGVATGSGFTPPAQGGTSRLAYILLAIFLGTFGVHNFYAGYTSKGVTQLLLTVLSCGILGIVVFIWNIVEICTVTIDAHGRPFSS